MYVHNAHEPSLKSHDPGAELTRNLRGCLLYPIAALVLVLVFGVGIAWLRMDDSLVGIDIGIVGAQSVTSLLKGTCGQEIIEPEPGHEFLLVNLDVRNVADSHRFIHRDQFVLEGDGASFLAMEYWPLGTIDEKPGTLRVMQALLNRQMHAGEDFEAELLYQVPAGLVDRSLRFKTFGQSSREDIDVAIRSVARVEALEPEKAQEDRPVVIASEDGKGFLRLWVRLHNTKDSARHLDVEDFRMVGEEFEAAPLYFMPRQESDPTGVQLPVVAERPSASLKAGEEKEMQLFFELPSSAQGAFLEVRGKDELGLLGDWVYRLMGLENTRRMALPAPSAVPHRLTPNVEAQSTGSLPVTRRKASV